MAGSKVLIVTGLKIYPPINGGHLRTLNFAKSLARMGYEVCIYCLAGRAGDYSGAQTTTDLELELRLIQRVNLNLGFGLCQTIARRLGIPRLWQYPLLRLGLIPQSLRQNLLSADFLVSDLVYIPPIPGTWAKKPWLLLSHNLEHRLIGQGSFWVRALFCGLMNKIEHLAHRRYAGIFACAAEDKLFFESGPPRRAPVDLIPNGVESALYDSNPAMRKIIRKKLGVEDHERLFVFTGSRYAPNDEALRHLQRFVARHLSFFEQKSIKFLILGSMGTRSNSPQMVSTGLVTSVVPYLQAADFAINPITRGSGSNVKTFEYLAARLPILSMTFGIRGTDLIANRDYISFNWENLLQRIDDLDKTRDAAAWRQYAEEVWQRHYLQTDMMEIVKIRWPKMLDQLQTNFN